MRVALVGNKGMLARDLARLLDESGIAHWGADLPELDITRPESIRWGLEQSEASVVINCAAYTAVDRAESEPDLAFAVNRDGVGHLAMACKRLNLPLLHLSTDYVFDGALRRPYREEDPPSPLGVYGASKLAGEEALRATHPRHVIVRTSWLFGALGQSFVKTILRLAREREDLRIVDDQFGCPTWTRDLAEALIQIARAVESPMGADGLWGTYHYCGLGQTSWCGFAREIIERAREWGPVKAQCVMPIPTAEYPTPAQRPLWSVLDCGKICGSFGIVQKDWRVGLAEVVQDLLADTPQIPSQ